MKPFHLNMGYLFEQPNESTYNLLRRCMICNPGAPLTLIESNLRLIDTKSKSTMDRLRQLKLTPDDALIQVKLPMSYQRQCPQCAKGLYHTDIYILPWLTHCPIHHCELTTICPGCNKSWPDKNELSRRDCNTCGLLTFNQIHLQVLPNLKYTSYTDIKKVNYFIKNNSAKKRVVLNSYNIVSTAPYNEPQWWKEVTYMDNLYPSFYVQNYKCVFKDINNELKVIIKSIKKKFSHLSPYEIERYDIKDPDYSNPLVHSELLQTLSSNINTQGRFGKARYGWDYQVMKNIIEWIHLNASENHRIHLEHYHYLDMYALRKLPCLCPYCIALSIWFFYIAWRQYDPFYCRRSMNYEFLFQSGYLGFYPAGEPILTVEKDKFVMDKNFTGWFYRRGLEILFLDILQYMFNLSNRLEKYKKGNRDYYNPKNRPPILDRYCSYDLSNDNFNFYYENEHPLNEFLPPDFQDINKTCDIFHQKLWSRDGPSFDFNITLSSSEFTYKKFNVIHENFREFVKIRY